MTGTDRADGKRGNKPRYVSILRGVTYSLVGLVLLITGVSAAFVLFPPGWLARDFIAAAVKRQTGRTLSVVGASKLTLRPDIRLRLEKVS